MFGTLFQKKQVQKKTTRHVTLVFVDRDKCTIISYPDSNVNLYQYQTSLVLDGDVLNREEFRDDLVKWIQDTNIKPSEAVYVVSPSVAFERTITAEEKQKNDELTLINSFIDSVPFQKIITSRLVFGGNTSIIVTNKDLLNGITYSFEQVGFTNVAVFPYRVIGDKTIPPSGNPLADLTELGKLFIEMVDTKNRQTLEFGVGTPKLATHAIGQMSVSEAAQQPVNPMVAVAAVLFLIMIGGGIMYWRFDQFNRLQKDTATRLQQGRLVTRTTKRPTRDASAAADLNDTTSKSKQKIQIVYNSKTETLAQKLRAALEKDQTVTVTEKPISDDVQSDSIILSDKAPTQLEAKITDALSTLSISIPVKSGNTVDVDAVIQLGKASPTLGGATPAPPTSAPTNTPTTQPSPTP